MGQEGKEKDNAVNTEDYDKVVVAHNSMKSENERLEKELNEMKTQQEGVEKDKKEWEEQQKANTQFQEDMKKKMDDIEKEAIVRKGIVSEKDKYKAAAKPVVMEQVKEVFSPILEAKKTPKEGSLNCLAYARNQQGTITDDYGTEVGGALVLAANGRISSPGLDGRDADIVVPRARRVI